MAGRVKPSDPQGAKAYYLVSVAWSDKLRNTATPLGWDSSPMQLTLPPPLHPSLPPCPQHFVTLSWQCAGTLEQSWVREAELEVNVLPKNTTQWQEKCQTCGTYWHWVPCANLLISHCLSCWTLYTVTLVFIFSTLISLHSCGYDKENLLDNQELLKLVIISIILVTFTFSLRVILWGEFRSQSLLGVKGLLKYFIKKAPNMPCERKWVPSYLLWLLSSKEPQWFNCTEDPSLWLSMAKELLPYAVSKSRLLCLLIEFRIKWLSN